MTKATFQTLIDFIFPIREKYCNTAGNEQQENWDFPNYGGLPKTISNTLSSEAVDAMQEIIQENWTNKLDFSKAYKKALQNLGERGNY
jgi:hypothetical protein